MATPLRILVIDDEWAILKSVRAWLESADFRVSTAVSGFDGLQFAGSLVPDLVLLDINMPLMSGLAALRMLQSNPLTGNVPIIVITGEVDIDGELLCVKGARGVLRKPFDRCALLVAIDEVLGYSWKND